jgi:hypothetical protein
MPSRMYGLACFSETVLTVYDPLNAGLVVDRGTNTACMQECGVFTRVSYIVGHFSFD